MIAWLAGGFLAAMTALGAVAEARWRDRTGRDYPWWP